MKKLKFILILLLFLSVESKSQWIQVSQLVSFAAFPEISVIDSNIVWVFGHDVTSNQIIFRTFDSGNNWVQTPSKNLPENMTCFHAIDSSVAFCGTQASASIYKTSNGGVSWVLIDSSSGSIRDIVFSKSFPLNGLALGAHMTGVTYFVYVTTNGGESWNKRDIDLIGNPHVGNNNSFIIDKFFWGFRGVTLNGESYVTNDQGLSFVHRTHSGSNAEGGIAFNDNKLTGIMTTTGSSNERIIKRTSNGGSNWSEFNTNFGFISGPNWPIWIAGTNTSFIYSHLGIIKSDFDGFVWYNTNAPIDRTYKIMDYKRYGNQIVAYVLGGGGAIIRGKFSVSVGITKNGSLIPDGYSLFQNFPNPFNSSTVIRFSIPSASEVKLKVYDNIGREISQLANDLLNAGNYEVYFNSETFTSGIYFYKIFAGEFRETKRMIILK